MRRPPRPNSGPPPIGPFARRQHKDLAPHWAIALHPPRPLWEQCATKWVIRQLLAHDRPSAARIEVSARWMRKRRKRKKCTPALRAPKLRTSRRSANVESPDRLGLPVFCVLRGIQMRSTSTGARDDNDLKDTRKLLDELRADVDAAYIALDTDVRSPVLRRSAIRAGLSYLDATLDHLKAEVRRGVDEQAYADRLSDAEFESLDTDQNDRDPSADRIPLHADLVMIVHLAGKIWDFDPFYFSPAPDASEALRGISLTQKRLSRPRRAIELEISDAELRHCSVAVTWVSAKLHRIVAAASADTPDRLLYATELYEYQRARKAGMKDEALTCTWIPPE